MNDDVRMSGNARATTPAERWEIEGFDPEDPTGSTLVLISSNGTALTMPFDEDLLDACITVARAWDGELDPSDLDEDDQWDGDEDDEDEDGALGGVSRLTGWHQVSAFWDNLPPETRRRVTIVVVVALVLLIVLTQFL